MDLVGQIDTYPERTPRTKLSMKKDPTTISGMKKTQLNTLPRASLVWKKLIINIKYNAQQYDTILILRKFKYNIIFSRLKSNHLTYPIQDRSPTFHCNTLKKKKKYNWNQDFWFSKLVILEKVFTWNTVSIAKPILSKDVIPLLGPSHFSIHIEMLGLHV